MQEPTTPPAPTPTATPTDGLVAQALYGAAILGVVLLILWRAGVLSRQTRMLPFPVGIQLAALP